ncbi:PE family protein [Mycobacterium ulcerans str. Harvey]|uniref:PE family protein n=1 Tax=Mycobacterium ulcerans str. Harvey TaxID=1299332 RepID=A0ABN0R1M8_MYCUL|nr:PE family protein [Mycobacterium ulcerans str. Harvey]
MIAAPEMLTAAAADIATIGSTISAADAIAAAPTTSVLAAAADEVSLAIAGLFSAHAKQYQAFSVQAATFHEQLVRSLAAGGFSYATAEAANASPLEFLLDAVNAPTQTLFGRDLIGNGTDGAAGTGANGGDGGLLWGNGGAGGQGGTGTTGINGGSAGHGGSGGNAVGLLGSGGAGGQGGTGLAGIDGVGSHGSGRHPPALPEPMWNIRPRRPRPRSMAVREVRAVAPASTVSTAAPAVPAGARRCTTPRTQSAATG